MLSAKISREFKNSGISILHQLIRQGRLKIYIALSNINIDVSSLAQAYRVDIVSLSLL